jgi:N-glycosylase/DNA lyase
MHKLSERFALPVLVLADPDAQDDDESETVYRLFPRAEDIPHDNLESVLRELGFGYRAGYLASSLASLTSRGPVDEELARWRSLPLDEVRNELLALKGVGRKVADCILLMCMDQVRGKDSISCYPCDTHLYF